MLGNHRSRKSLLDIFFAAILTVTAMPAPAQWLSVPADGIPKTKDGKPNLRAPAPRKWTKT